MPHYQNGLLSTLVITLCISLLASCGGGGGGGSTTNTNNLSNTPPVVSVSSSMIVNAGETVTLKATATDQDGNPITYSWTQTSGKRVRFDDEGAASTTFLAPSTPGSYTFHADVSDGTVTVSSGDITINVLAYTGSSVRFTQNPLIELATIADAQSLEVVNNRAYVAVGTEGMFIYDTTIPSSPVKLGAFTPASFNGLQLAVSGSRVAIYGLASPNHGIRIVDVSTPSNPVAAGGIVTGVLLIRDLELSSDGKTLYVATDIGLRIYDLTTPASPVLLALDSAYNLANEITSLKLTESGTSRTLYTLSGGVLNVLNVTNPTTNLTITGTLTAPTVLNEMQLYGTKIYATGLNGGGLNIIDISAATPTLLGTWQSAGWTMRSIAVKLNTAYIADWFRGVAVVDVTDPANITLIGEYDTPGRVFDLSLQNNSLFVADNGIGMQVLDVTTPSQSQSIRSLGTTVNGRDVAVRNGRAFLVDSDYTGPGMIAYDVSNPLTPSILGSYGASGSTVKSTAKSVKLQGKNAVTAGSDGLNIIDVSSPAAMSLLGKYTYIFASTTYSSIALKQNYAYLGTEDTPGSLHTFDITDVSKPVRVDTDSIGASEFYPITSLAIDGSTVHVGTTNTLFNADLTNPANPVMGGSNVGMLFGNFTDVVTVAEKVIVAILDNFQIFNTSALPVMSKASQYTIDSNGLAVSGRHLYATQNHEYYTGTDRPSLYIFDIADSANPTLTGMFDLPNKGRKLNVSDGYVFIATKSNGLAMMQAEPVLSTRYNSALRNSVLPYIISWNEFPSSVATELKCVVTGGVCSISAINQAARSATISWTMPAFAGDYEMAVVVGDQHSFYSTRDRITAQ